MNYFDTAYVYGAGNSERALGKAIKQLPREKIYIADKMPPFLIKEESDIDRIFNETLENLDVDYIDFYLMHCINEGNYKKMVENNLIDWAIQKKKEGKIKHIGFSIHATDALLEKTLELHDWEFVQIQYNYMDIVHEPGEAGYKMLRERNIPIVIMEPLKGGLLANITGEIAKPFSEIGGSNASYSFRWLMEKEGVITVLSGVSNFEQTAENCEIFAKENPLSEAEKSAIAKVKANIEASQRIGCTGCGYCLPCPVEVNIPALFKSWNLKSMVSSEGWISGMDIDYEMAEKCIACGKCNSHCPQNLDIPNGIAQILSEKA